MSKRKTFAEIIHEGSAYNWMWIAANEAAISAAQEQGMTHYTEKNKRAIAGIVLSVLDTLNKRGALVLEPTVGKI